MEGKGLVGKLEAREHGKNTSMNFNNMTFCGRKGARGSQTCACDLNIAKRVRIKK